MGSLDFFGDRDTGSCSTAGAIKGYPNKCIPMIGVHHLEDGKSQPGNVSKISVLAFGTSLGSLGFWVSTMVVHIIGEKWT